MSTLFGTLHKIILKNHIQKKKAIHQACGYSINLLRSYKPNKNTHNFHRAKDCIEKLCEDLTTQAMEEINFKEKNDTINTR